MAGKNRNENAKSGMGMKKNRWILNSIMVGIEVIWIVVVVIIYNNKYNGNAEVIYNVIAAAIGVTIGMTIYFHMENKSEITDSKYREYLLDELNPSRINEKTKVGRKGNRKENQNDIEDEKTDVVLGKSDKKDIIALMLKNNDETMEYFQISKNQAKSSFLFSIIACIVGIVMIGISLYSVFKMKDTQFAIISIVGGAVTELIAGTVLVIHNKSALQLNYYYDALHENEKFLSAINLADKLEDDDKRDMYIEIIRAQIQTANFCKKEEHNNGKNSD